MTTPLRRHLLASSASPSLRAALPRQWRGSARVLGVILLTATGLWAQTAPVPRAEPLPASFLPKSPSVAPFHRFDEQRNVDMMTGAAQVSLPLVEIRSGLLHLPVSLGYSYTGLRVYQPRDLVGLGWSLQAGGSISRQVNGIPDELPNAFGSGYNSLMLRSHFVQRVVHGFESAQIKLCFEAKMTDA